VTFSNYIVYVDESGDHGPVSRDFPVFVLAFCVFEKTAYAGSVTESLHRFKFRYFGHDAVVLHEREIRKSQPPFDMLLNAKVRGTFMQDLDDVIARAEFTLIAAVIRKDKLSEEERRTRWHPYHSAMRFGLERLGFFLRDRGVAKTDVTHVVFESRGKKEDDDLELEFRRMKDALPARPNVDIVFASKGANHCGLQFADLIARPIGLHVLRPHQPNRAYDTLSTRFRRSPDGEVMGWGLKIFP
jgi:hypothetical protein